MSTFLQCPLKFRIETMQKLPGGTNAAAVAGTTMHAALEKLMNLPGPERTVERLAAEVEQALVEVRDDPDYLSLTKEQLKDFDAKCRRVTPRAFDMLPLQTLDVHSTELRLEVELDGWILRGIIDLIEDRDNFGLIVWDYKSGKAPMKQYEAKATLGLEFYAVMVNIELGVMPAGVGLLYLDKKVSIKRVPSVQSVKATERKILAVRDSIVKACETDSFKTSTSALCDYCACKPYCPAHGGDPDDVPVSVRLSS